MPGCRTGTSGVQASPLNKPAEAPLDGQHRAKDGAIARVPGDPGTEYVFPDHHPAAIHPGGVELGGVIVVPAPDLVLHVTPLEPLVPQHARGFAVTKPLCPGGMVIVYVLQRHGIFAFQDDPGPRGIQPGAEVRSALAHRVQEDPVRLQRSHQLGQHVEVGRTLAARAHVPGIVVNVNLDPPAVESAHGETQTR